MGHHIKLWDDKYACTGESKGGHHNLKKKSTEFKNALVGHFEPSLLSNVFFSADNIDLLQKSIIIGVKQKSNGRIWTNSMWYPDMLKIIYDVFDDKINKYCLENKRIKKINLIKQDI